MMLPDSPNEIWTYDMHDAIWLGTYGALYTAGFDYSQEILSEPGYSQLLNLIKNIRCKSSEIHYGCSHYLAYPWAVTKTYDKRKMTHTPYRLINIDFHCDLSDRGDDVDCDNWIRSLAQATKLKQYVWIGNPQSKYEQFQKQLIVDFKSDTIKFDIHSHLFDEYDWDVEEIDHIFICKSPVWAPPHLDKDFLGLIDSAKDRFKMTDIDISDINRDKIHRDRYADYESDGSLIKTIDRFKAFRKN